ncbi:MAG: glycosyltransferase family A protein [Planctomycetota bacterium]
MTSGPTNELPLVSIVVNNFNYERFLRQSIDSALDQDHPRTEVVVVDDCSTDGSRALIQGYGDRIVPVLQEENGGQGAAMNVGFDAASGDVVIFLDADDYLYPQAASAVAAAYRDDAAVIQYRLHLVDEEGAVLDLYPRPELRFDQGDVRQKLLTTGRFEGTVTSGQAFGRKALAAALPMPADRFRISADGYLLSTVPFHGQVIAIEEPHGAYRLHGNNLWSAVQNRAAGFRRSLEHDADKLREVRAQAESASLEIESDPELRDYQHLSARLGSLLFDRSQHPYPKDRRLGLALRGWSAARRSSFGGMPRLMLGIWFLGTGLLPGGMARSFYRWRFESDARPKILRRTASTLRRVLGKK